MKISNVNLFHRIGLSDAYMSQYKKTEQIIRTITLYGQIDLDKEKIRDGVSVIFDMYNSKFN